MSEYDTDTDNLYTNFLKNNKVNMFSFIHIHFFTCSNENDYNLIIKCCQKYLSLFSPKPYTYYDKHIDNDDLKQFFLIQYFLATSYRNINNISECLNTFENILSNNRCPQDIKEWCLYNSGLIYKDLNSKQDFTIPRIIHVVFFGFTPFEKHHYRCLKSMLNFMCDLDREENKRYSLFIHTCFDKDTNEPKLNASSNKYWSEIISHHSVKLIPAKVPEEVDGFPLNYFQYKADVYRIDILYKYGGVYLDADLLLIKPFDNLIQDSYASFYICEENPKSSTKPEEDFVINAFIASTPGNPVLLLWKESISSTIRQGAWANHIRVNHAVWRDYPHNLAKYGIKVLPNTHFFDFSWQAADVFKCNIKPVLKDEHYGFHLWETILNEDVKNKIFLPGCEYRHNNKVPIDDLFDRVVIITTNDEEEKTQNTLKELIYKANISPHKVCISQNKKHSTSSVIGCRESHIQAIKYANDNDLSSIMIVENDIHFQHDFDSNQHLCSYIISKPPLDWDILYLGGILTSYSSFYLSETDKYTNDRSYENAMSCDWIKGTIWCNHAYIVRKHMYKPILDYYEKFLNKLQQVSPSNNENDIAPFANIDHFYTHIIQNKPQYNCYLSNKQDIIQLPDKNGKWAINQHFNWNTFSMKVILDSNIDIFDSLNINWNNL